VRASPPVVVYITREHPVTAVDQLLVFDIAGKQRYQAIVPGGGIEEGETVEQAARREAREETGVDVGPVRHLGTRAESHFVQAEPVRPTPDEWEHLKTPGEELVRCRWVEVRPDLGLWGDRGAFIHTLIRRRVVAYVTRERARRTELLTIEAEHYPEEGIQAPAGRLDHGESLEEGLRRELAEETGVTRARIVRELPDFESMYRSFCENHAFHLIAEEETPDSWRHEVQGKGADAGLVYRCRWLPLTTELRLWKELDPMLEKLSKSGSIRRYVSARHTVEDRDRQ
jgi:ADP-ribose pyrophosphatase YjhB (NUDIX family)